MSIDILTEYADLVNIATELHEDELNDLGMKVVENYWTDKNSRADWEERNEEATKLASQVVEEKTSPWPGAANIKFPLLTEASIQFNARAYSALMPGNTLVSSRVVGYDPQGLKMDQGTRVSRHMSYQLLEQMEEWEEEQDALLFALPILGSMFKKSYYDPILERNKSEIIYPQYLVVDYYARSLEQAFRKTHVIHSTENDIAIMKANGIYLDVDVTNSNIETKDLRDEIYGISGPSESDASEFHILEQHTYEDLDGDGIAEPYIITVHEESQKVLRITAGYSVDDIKLNEAGEVAHVPQRQYFTKYSFMPSPDGSFYDMGFGNLLAPLNHVINTVINQLLDAGTMSNLQSGFLSRGVRMKNGNQRFKPGEWKTVNSTGDDLRKGIYPLPVREPNSVLFQLLGTMVNASQRLAGTVDSMVGENPGQNQKATTTMAVLDQGQKVFHGIYKRLHRSFKRELQKLFILNSENLSAEEYFNVLDFPADAQNLERITRDDYNPDSVNITPAADSSVSTQQQKLAKAQGLLELLPTGLINEMEAVKRVLEAQEQPALETVLKQPQPPQPTPEFQLEQHKTQEEIKLKWAEYQLAVVAAQQNDLEIQTKAILNIANAEAAEEGTQIDAYRAQLERVRQESEEIGKKAAGLSGQDEEDYSQFFKDE